MPQRPMSLAPHQLDRSTLRTCQRCGAALIWATRADGFTVALHARPETRLTLRPNPNGDPTVEPVRVYEEHHRVCAVVQQRREPS